MSSPATQSQNRPDPQGSTQAETRVEPRIRLGAGTTDAPRPQPGLVTRFHLLEIMVVLAITGTALFNIPADFAYPAHWGVSGPDWLWPRLWALALAPFWALGCAGIFALVGWLLPKARLEMVRHVLEPALTGLLGVAVVVQFGLLLAGVGSDIDLIRIMAFALVPVLLLLGIVLAEAERHTYAGLRLPWHIPKDGPYPDTEAPDRIWRLSHRVVGGGFMLGAGGLGLLAWLAPDLGNLVSAVPVVLLLPVLAARLTTTIMVRLGR